MPHVNATIDTNDRSHIQRKNIFRQCVSATRIVHELNSQPESSVAVFGFDPVCGVSRVEASTHLSSGVDNYSGLHSGWVWCMIT